jgi:hypothetical protein
VAFISSKSRAAAQAPRKKSDSRSVLNIVAHVLMAGFVHLQSDLGIIGDKSAYFVLTILVLTLGLFEIQMERQRDPRRWLLNPAVLTTLLTFVLSYGVTNLLFLLPVFSSFIISRNIEFHVAMATSQYYTVLALAAMWLGYRIRLSQQIGCALGSYFPVSRGTSVNRSVIIGMMVIAIAARSYQLSIGIYGYMSLAENLTANASISQYLAMASRLGLLALALAALQAYRPSGQPMDTSIMIVLLVVEVAFGFLSGFKGAVLTPMIVVILCRYMTGRGISRRHVLAGVALLFMSYAIIEPFRESYNTQGRGGTLDFASVAQMLAASDSVAQRDPMTAASLFQQVALRLNLSNIGAYGIEYANDPNGHSPDDPNFLENILLSPAMAVIPREVWSSKPLADSGQWYTRQVLGLQIDSSTAMGPVSFLYMAGGVTAIVVFFLIIGMMQRALFVWFNPFASFGGMMVYLAVVGHLASLESAIDSLFVTMIREVPLMLILSHLIIRRGNRA